MYTGEIFDLHNGNSQCCPGFSRTIRHATKKTSAEKPLDTRRRRDGRDVEAGDRDRTTETET